MKLKDKIKSYSFWVSLASAIILILKVLGNRFGFTVDETMVSDLFTALCSILVLLGIIVIPSSPVSANGESKSTSKDKLNIITEDLNNSDSFQIINTPVMDNNEHMFDVNESEFVELESEIDNTSIIQSDINTQIDTDITQQPEPKPPTEKILSEETHTVQEQQYDTHQIVEEIESNQQDKQYDVFEQPPRMDESINPVQPTNISALKEIFNSQRVKFTNNINEYILELQEEIRKAREQM